MQPLVVFVHCSGQPTRDCPGRSNTSPYVKLSSTCLLLRLSGAAVFHTVHYSQPGGVGDQTDYQQGHSAPLPSPAVVVGCKLLRDVPTLAQVTAISHVMQRLAHDVQALFYLVQSYCHHLVNQTLVLQ